MGWKMLFEEYQDVCLVLISEWNYFIYSESPCCMMHPNKFLLKRIYGLEEGCLLHDHLLYLSEMLEAFISLFWPEASNQVSANEDIWFGGEWCLTNIKIAV